MSNRLCAAFLLSLFVLPVLAENAPIDTYGFRRLVATPTQNGQLTQIAVDGDCSFPDNTGIDITVEHRGERCPGLIETVTPKGGAFSGQMSTTKKLLPGYYVVKAQFAADRQEGDILKLLKNIPMKCATQAFAVGNEKEIKDIRDEHLKMYEAQLAQIEDSFGKMDVKYAELVKKYDMRESPLQWNRLFSGVPVECQERIGSMDKMFADCEIPVFPLMHSWTREGWGLLQSLYNTLTSGLTIEISEMMSRKGVTRDHFLKQAEAKMAAYLKGMRAQIALERKLDQREAVVHDVTELSRLYDESSNTFDQVRAIGSEDVKAAWKGFMEGKDGKGGWRGALKTIEAHLQTYHGGVLEAECKDLVDLLSNAPGSLIKLWGLYDRVLLKGEKEEDLHKQIHEALDECYVHIFPVMEVLGFSREAFNRQMERYEGSSEDGAPDKEPIATTVSGYVQSLVDKLDSKDLAEAAKAFSVLLKLGEPAKKILQDTLNSPKVPNERITGLIVICLGKMGEKAMLPRLLSIVNDSRDDSLRAAAVMTLPQLGGVDSMSVIVKVLGDDKSPAVRTAAANALALLHTPSTLEALIKAFMDDDLGVREAAWHSANSLAGVAFHFAPDAAEAQRKADQQTALKWYEDNKQKLNNPSSGDPGAKKDPGK